MPLMASTPEVHNGGGQTVSARIQSIERAAAILRSLTGRSRRLGVAELASELRLPKGTVYGILRTLQTVGFVEQHRESGKYQVGPALLHIGSIYLEASELRLRALPWAEALSRQVEEAVGVGTLHDNRVLIVHQSSRPDDPRPAITVGSLLPLHATALGKALAAARPELLDGLLPGALKCYTPATITDPVRLGSELDAISKRGWAADVAELLPGLASVAAPIESHGMVIGAIAISGPADRLVPGGSPPAPLTSAVMESALRISRELGGIPW
jgi:DNA-binding IclR family transcriptional regulator